MQSIFDAWQRGERSTLLHMATGMGKTVTFSEVINRVSGNVLVIAHRIELIEQGAETIHALTGERVEVEKADSWARDPMAGGGRIVFASIQTLNAEWAGSKRYTRFKPDHFDYVIVDECHHSVAETWQRVIDYFHTAKVLGVTATPKRRDEKAMGRLFDSVAYSYGMQAAIRDGWLVPIRQKVVYVEGLDLSGVRVTAGDLNGAELAQVLAEEAVLHGMIQPSIDLVEERQAILFAGNVEHATRCAELLRRAGREAAVVTGGTPKEERAAIFRDFREGRLQYLTNVGVATEGTNLPTAAVGIMARPIHYKSRSLYEQCVGRVVRAVCDLSMDSAEERRQQIAASDKPFALIIDFAGNAGKHKLVTPVDLLGGTMTDEVRDRMVVKAALDGGFDDIAELEERTREEIEAEIAAKKEEERRQQEEIERKRQSLVVGSKYRTLSVDPFDLLDLPAPQRAATSRPVAKIEPSLPQKKLLMSNKIDPEGLSKAEATRLCGIIISRRRRGLCSLPQMNLLKKWGVDADQMTRKEASRIISERLGR